MKAKLKLTLLLTLAILLTSLTAKSQTNFGHLKAAVKEPGGKVYFFTDKQYFRYNTDNNKLEKKAKILGVWKDLPDQFDAALLNPGNQKAYFFKGDTYYKYDFKTGVEYTGKIGKNGWRGVPANIDAAVVHPNDKIYFFKGDKYYRYSHALGKVDKVANISNWKGVPKNLDAALLDKTGTIYFFKGNKYYRYNTKTGVDKTGIIGKDGWRGLSFSKKLQNATPSSKKNLRLKVTLTRIKSIQARDSDNIADFLMSQWVTYKANGNEKNAATRKINVLSKSSISYTDELIRNTIINSNFEQQLHVKEGDDKHFINNSIEFNITNKESKDRNATFKIYTTLDEVNYYFTGVRNFKLISLNTFIKVNIYEILDYLQAPNASKYRDREYFNGGWNGKQHESGPFGKVMWFERASNNALKGTLEFGNNDKETYVRFYYRFELVP